MIPESVHWFRKADNNPFVVDSTVIDSATYSRSIVNDLPAGHSWAANANRRVGEALGTTNTQAVMYSMQSEAEEKTLLTADDVAMVQMGMTGQDRLAGTPDDYAIKLKLVDPCVDPVHVLVLFGFTEDNVLGGCMTAYDFSFPQNPFLTFHVTLQSPEVDSPLIIILDENVIWDFGEEVFFAGFETGDASEWSAVAGFSATTSD